MSVWQQKRKAGSKVDDSHAYKELGFENYDEYLESKFWRLIKDAILKRDKNKCSFCNESATQVHHTSYARPTIIAERTHHLYSTCRSCHYKCHFSPRNKKLYRKTSVQKTLGMAFKKSGSKNYGLMIRDRFIKFEMHDEKLQETLSKCFTKVGKLKKAFR